MRLLSLKHFRQALKKTAAAKSPEDLLPEDYIHVYASGRAVRISYKSRDVFRNLGDISMSQSSCGDAYVVQNMHANHGWGPMLSDLAMEIATLLGDGIIADRNIVSLEAESVMEHYMRNRSDVSVYPMSLEDCPFNIVQQLFKQEGPEFSFAHPAIRAYLFFEKPFERGLGLGARLRLLLKILKREDPRLHQHILQAYKDSSLSKRYEKAPKLLRQLKQEGKLQMEGLSL